MNRAKRRDIRQKAMQHTLVHLNNAVKELRYSDPKREVLNAQREYLAQQIADASYTVYWSRYLYLLTSSIQEKVKVLTDAYGYHMYLAEDIQRLADTCRRWNMQDTKHIWLAD